MTKCPICQGQEYVIENVRVRDCECFKSKRRRLVLEKLGIPRSFEFAKLSDYDIRTDASGETLSEKDAKQKTTARAVVTAFIDEIPRLVGGETFAYEGGHSSPTLVMLGQRSSGKTLLAACITLAGVERNLPVHYYQWAEVMESCSQFDNPKAEELLARIKRSLDSRSLVVIDNLDSSYEFGEGSGDRRPLSTGIVRKLDYLFVGRAQNAAPLVITTDQNPSQLGAGKFGPVVTSLFDDANKIKLPTMGRGKDQHIIGE